MKRDCLLVFTACLCFASLGSAGDLWLHATTGSEVFLDGESTGVIESVDAGIRVPGLAPGEHTIAVWKDGVMSAEFGFALGYAPTQLVVVEPESLTENAVAEAADRDETVQPVGAIEVTSNPKECEIRLGTRKYTKEQPILMFVGMPVGGYDLRFESGDTYLRTAVAVQTGQPAQIKVDFSSSRVAVVAVPSIGAASGDHEDSENEPECIEYWIQVLRTDDLDVIDQYQQVLQELGFYREYHKVITVDEEGAEPYYKLRVGPLEHSKKAKWAAGQIRNAGIPTVWIAPEECDPNAKKREKKKYRPIH